MMHSVRLSFLVMLLLLVGTTAAQDDDTTNLAACVDTYDENVDYFPVKSVFDYAEGVSVTYFNNYKVVTVTNAFYDAPAFDYVLVQCGTPAPSADDFPEGTLFIDVPINDAVVLSTTQLPHFVDLGLLDNLVAVDSGFYIYNQEIQDLVASGDIAEVGSGPSVNVELVLDLDPDMVFTYGYNPDSDAHPILIESGVFTALNGEYREAHPLGRAEWLKFTGLFFNAEAEVNILFEDIAIAYEDLRELTSLIPADERVEVLTSTFSSFSDAWSVPGSETYAGFFLQDAGANVVLGDQVSGSSESELFDFEVVYDAGIDAPIWFLNAFGVNTLDDLLAQDERYADFAAFQNGGVYNNVGRVNANGGSDYYESAVTAPHIILADFIAILYPDLLPDHDLVYWVPVE